MSTGNTGPAFSCIPDLSTFVPVFLQPEVKSLKCCKPNGNQLYSLGYAGVQVAQFLTDGIFDGLTGFTGFTGFTGTTGTVSLDDAITRAEFWFGRLTVFLVLPWLLIFIALFIYLGITGLMSGAAVIIFIIMTLVLAGFSLFLIIWDARQTVITVRNDLGFALSTIIGDIRNTVTQKVNTVVDRWNTYEVELIGRLIDAYTLEAGCTKDPYECCDFDNCTVGCLTKFSVLPDIVPTSATGILNLEISGGGVTAAYFVIPPELNGGTGTTIQSLFGVATFPYTTGPIDTAATITAVVYLVDKPPFTLTHDVIIVTGATGVIGTDVLPESYIDYDEATDIANAEVETPYTKDTKSSMEQLQKALQEARLLQENLQRRLTRRTDNMKDNRAQQPIQNDQVQRGGSVAGCRGCVKRPTRGKVCPNGNCQ